jgi:hypothetical protein
MGRDLRIRARAVPAFFEPKRKRSNLQSLARVGLAAAPSFRHLLSVRLVVLASQLQAITRMRVDSVDCLSWLCAVDGLLQE